jgi:hypothetical protein
MCLITCIAPRLLLSAYDLFLYPQVTQRSKHTQRSTATIDSWVLTGSALCLPCVLWQAQHGFGLVVVAECSQFDCR